MSVGSIIAGVIIIGTGIVTILFFIVGFVWGIFDAIREHKKERAEKKAALKS